MIRQIGHQITNLKLSDCKISVLDLVDLLTSTPNLKKLEVEAATIQPNGKKWKRSGKLNLPKLMKLTLSDVDPALNEVFENISAAFCYLKCDSPNAGIVAHHQSIENFTIVIMPDDGNALPNLLNMQLKWLWISLIVPTLDEGSLTRLLQSQHNLYSLALINVSISQEMLQVITNMQTLNSLRISTDNIEDQDVKAINKVNLWSLGIEDNSPTSSLKLDALCSSKNDNISDLDLHFPSISCHQIIQIRESFPNLSALELEVQQASDNVLQEVLRLFNNLESLYAVFETNSNGVLSVGEIPEDNLHINHKMEDLTLQVGDKISSRSIKKLARLLPNVETLNLKSFVNTNDIRTIVKLKKLVKLKVKCHRKDVKAIIGIIDKDSGIFFGTATLKLEEVHGQDEVQKAKLKAQRFSLIINSTNIEMISKF